MSQDSTDKSHLTSSSDVTAADYTGNSVFVHGDSPIMTGSLRGRLVKPYERFDLQYRNILDEVMFDGIHQGNRTGIASKWIPSARIKVDLQVEFPVLTLRRVFPKAAIAEMCGFLRGYTDSQHFADLGCKYWHENANSPTKGSDTSPWLSSRHRIGENDLGEIYGDLWRNWLGDDGMVVDQVADLVEAIVKTPDSRRILVTGWKPESVKQVRGALPTCHVLWRVMIDTQKKEMHLSWYQRSTDLILGTPANMVEYAFLLHVLARLTGYTPRTVTGHLDCVHVYENHFEAAEKLQDRPMAFHAPQFAFSDKAEGKFDPTTGEAPVWWLKTVGTEDCQILNYHPGDSIPNLAMAV